MLWGQAIPPCQPMSRKSSPATFQPHQHQGLSPCPPGFPGCVGSPQGLSASWQGRVHSSQVPLGQEAVLFLCDRAMPEGVSPTSQGYVDMPLLISQDRGNG